MLTHEDFHFSITIHTDDLAVLHCLRGLSMHAQSEGNKRIPWGGTKEADWLRRHRHATFFFSSPEYRSNFEHEAKRLLPEKSWDRVGTRDDHPAEPQSGKGAWD